MAAALALLIASAAHAEPAPIPVRDLFQNPRFSSPRLSPDGATLALLASEGDVQIVATRPLAGGPFAPIVKFSDPAARPTSLEWAKPDLVLFSAESRVADLDGRVEALFSADVGSRTIVNLGWAPDIAHWLPADRDGVLVRMFAQVLRMNLRTGRSEIVVPRVYLIHTWHLDGAAVPRVGIGGSGERYELWYRPDASGPPRKILAHRDELGPWFLAFHASPSKLYVMKSHEGRDAVFELDVNTGAVDGPVFAHPRFDVDAAVFDSPVTRRVTAFQFVGDRTELHFIDAQAEAEHAFARERISALVPSPIDLETVSTSGDGARRIVRVSSDTRPPRHFVVDRVAHSVSPLLEEFPSLEAVPLAATRAVSYQARDGLEIPAYLTLPVGGARTALPLIVNPHGGPWARDRIAWNPEVQLFASRGFAVLQMNFRGSTGYGRRYEEAGFHEWGGKIQQDIADGVRWAIAEGIADPDRVGIYGASFGGYSAFAGLAMTPELYRAGASYAGVSDIRAMIMEDMTGGSFSDFHTQRTGRYYRDRKLMRATSPITLVGAIRAPVLIGHGDEDETVDVEHSRRMAKALRDAGKQVEYLEFPHEVHGFLLEANRVKWYEALAAFFEKNLAPREEPAAGSAPAALAR